MKLLFDFFQVVLFFCIYRIFDIYTATIVTMIASVIQVLLFKLKYQRFDTMHLMSLLIIVTLGSATLILHNPWFIKWKPTGIYWITAMVFLWSHFFNNKTIIQKVMEKDLVLPQIVWLRINAAWILFFIIMGFANLYIAYNYSTKIWVNFKLFGGIGLTLLFVMAQALYLSRHIQERN